MANELGELAIRIGGDIGPLSRSLQNGTSKINRFAKQSRRSLNVVGKLGVAATAAGAAITAGLVKSGMESAEALRQQASAANVSEKQLLSLAKGARRYGIDLKGTSDILRDMNDRVGDFVQTGAGPMADFFENIAPKVGVTAQQFRRLNSRDALQLFVDSLEKANVNQQDFTFYMEAMSSESTKLLPLLRNNGEQAREYAERVERLGLALSAVDHEQIALGSEAMADLTDMFESATQHLAKEFAPILQAVSNELQGAATEAGGMGGLVSDAFEKGMQAAAFMANAIDGVKRAFETMADSVIIGMTTLLSEAASKVEKILNLANMVPKVDLSGPLASVRGFMATMEGVSEEAGKNIKKNLEEPLAGDAFLANVRDAQAKAQAAAEEMAKNRPKVGGISSGAMTDEEREAAKKRIQDEVGLLWERFDQETEAYEKHQARLNAIEQRGIKTRRDYEVATASQRLSFMSGTMSKIISGVSNGNKKMAKIAQDLALFQVGVSLPAAVMEAVKNAGGMPFGAWAGAATLAEGIGRINQIKSQSLGSGGAGVTSSSPSGGSAAASGGAGQVSGATGQPMQQVQISGLDPDSIFKGSQFIDAANKAQEEGYQLVF